jgi:hypothetical protein
MQKKMLRAVAVATLLAGGAFAAKTVEPAVAVADPDDEAGPEEGPDAPRASWDSHENDTPDWDASGGWRPGPDGTWIPPDGGDPVQGVPVGRLPSHGFGSVPRGRSLPLPFVAPKGTSCGQMLATSVGGTMDNVVGMSTGPVLGYFGHNVLGPAAGNIVGGVLVHVC